MTYNEKYKEAEKHFHTAEIEECICTIERNRFILDSLSFLEKAFIWKKEKKLMTEIMENRNRATELITQGKNIAQQFGVGKLAYDRWGLPLLLRLQKA